MIRDEQGGSWQQFRADRPLIGKPGFDASEKEGDP